MRNGIAWILYMIRLNPTPVSFSLIQCVGGG
jgi:hypothetical protein